MWYMLIFLFLGKRGVICGVRQISDALSLSSFTNLIGAKYEKVTIVVRILLLKPDLQGQNFANLRLCAVDESSVAERRLVAPRGPEATLISFDADDRVIADIVNARVDGDFVRTAGTVDRDGGEHADRAEVGYDRPRLEQRFLAHESFLLLEMNLPLIHSLHKRSYLTTRLD
jgi:hypothetical protein